MFTDMATRKYQLKRRAEQQAETRQRIVEAMVGLHREVGPARTTVSAIAERAGGERLTVYRHSPDEPAMFEACTAHYATEVPGPRSAAWAGIEDPAERLRAALLAFYDYYGRAGGELGAGGGRRAGGPAAAPCPGRGAHAVGGVRGPGPGGAARGVEGGGSGSSAPGRGGGA